MSRFLSAVSAVLFLTVCAYLGAALFAPDTETETETGEPLPAAVRPPSLRGIALREETVTDRVFEDGARVSAADTGDCSAVYFASCDGYEFLSADPAAEFTAGTLNSLLSAAPEPPGAGRLVTGRAWYIAAFADGPLPSEGRVRLAVDGLDRALDAEICALSEEAGSCAVLLRLTDGSPEALSLRKITGKILIE